MWKALIFSTLFVGVAIAGIIHDHYEHHEPEHHGHHELEHHEPEHDTDHEHKVEHEHATSHQSFKIHHFHAVPVYVKKEDQKYLKHPVEIGGLKHKLKLVHPETEKHHGYGLVLENHTEEKNHKALGHEHHEEYHYQPEHHDFGGGEESGHDSHHQYHDINLHHHSD